MKKYSSYIYRKSTKIAVTSPSFGNYLSSVTGINSNDIEYIPQHSQDIISQIVDNTQHYKDDVVNIVFLGNVGESQNVHHLVKAASMMGPDTKYHIHIIGSGSYLEEVKNQTKELGMQDYVTFHGRQPKAMMSHYYQMADVCYLSLRDEGCVSYTIPGKLQEYMSAGKAVLASIKGDAATIINDARCGIVVDNDNCEALAIAMSNMVNDKTLVNEYGVNARNYYLKHFTLEQHVNKLESSLKELINK